MTARGSSEIWEAIPARLRARGLRWTKPRQTLVEVLARTSGHVTGTELVDRCRRVEPRTVPSTVYRTLDVLEDLGVVHHCHGADGREEYHVLPDREHGHFYCERCGSRWDIPEREAMATLDALRARGLSAPLSHFSVVGMCDRCREAAAG